MNVGDKVVATREITEGGSPYAGDPDAETIDSPHFIHAEKGDEGEIVHINDEGVPTVQFGETATIVSPSEYEL